MDVMKPPPPPKGGTDRGGDRSEVTIRFIN